MHAIAIISDTHMPKGDRALPPVCVERLGRAEHIIHAGDFIAASVYEDLRSAHGPITAVHGNVDDESLRARLPATATLRLGSITIAVIHDAGPARGRLDRLRRRFSDADAVIFGHSHLPLHERMPDGFQIFNPGSPTERRRAPHRTMGVARIDDDGINFEVIVVD